MSRSSSSTAKAAAPRTITLADVARQAGVATMTASRALSRPDMVSDATRQKVLAAVKATGYVPNLYAAGLRAKSKRLIACMVPTIASGSAFLQSLQSMNQAFVDAGYQVMLYERGYDRSRDDAVIDAVLARRPDGVALTGALRSTRGRKRLREAGMPVVETWDMAETPVDMVVGFSHRKVGAAIAHYLHERGCRCVAGIDGHESRTHARFVGFAEAAMQLGIAGQGLQQGRSLCIESPSRLAHGREGLAHALQDDAGLDGFYAASDMMALGACIEARERRLPVPRALAIVGFGDFDFAADVVPSLTTVRVDHGHIGRRAAQMLIARIEGRDEGPRVQDVGFQLVRRDSA